MKNDACHRMTSPFAVIGMHFGSTPVSETVFFLSKFIQNIVGWDDFSIFQYIIVSKAFQYSVHHSLCICANIHLSKSTICTNILQKTSPPQKSFDIDLNLSDGLRGEWASLSAHLRSMASEHGSPRRTRPWVATADLSTRPGWSWVVSGGFTGLVDFLGWFSWDVFSWE